MAIPARRWPWAPVAYTVWKDFLRYDPADPAWPNRDRFVLSCGHASMLLYSLIHLAGIRRGTTHDALGAVSANEPAVSLESIKKFRQLDSVCAGHPEHHMTSGIETTTGPLGQGCGNSVGMAMASRWLAAHYNTPGHVVFDYDTYVLCSDGDLMEGVACEAASIAGHLGLANLCWIYDDNFDHDRRKPISPSARTWRRSLRGWAGGWSTSPTPTTPNA